MSDAPITLAEMIEEAERVTAVLRLESEGRSGEFWLRHQRRIAVMKAIVRYLRRDMEER